MLEDVALLQENFFLRGSTALVGLGLLCEFFFFSITLRHTPLGRTPLGEWSARRRDLYLTTHNIHKGHIRALGGIRARKPSQRATLDREAIGIGTER